MRTLPSFDEWERLCRGNAPSDIKHALRTRGWSGNNKASVEPALALEVNRYWAQVCRARAERAASCLPGLGFVPTFPYGEELTKEVEAMLVTLNKQRWSYVKTRDENCWDQLVRCLPHLSDEQSLKLAESGRWLNLMALLDSGAWSPRSEAFFKTARVMEENYGYQGDYLLEAAYRANPGLVEEQTAAFRRSVERRLTNHVDLYRSSRKKKDQMQAAEEGLVVLCQALEPHGGVMSSTALHLLAERGNFRLVSVLGRLGSALPSEEGSQKRFFAAMLKAPFEGEADGRLEENPWRHWLDQCDPQVWSSNKSVNPAVVAAWTAWSLERRLAEEPAARSTPKVRL